MANLIAYIPTINQRHLNWFKKYPESNLYLIPQAEAEKLLPRLARNMVAIPTDMVAQVIFSQKFVRRANIFMPGWGDDNDPLLLPPGKNWILPDEDVTHLFAEKYLLPAGCNYTFEMIWARYDMRAVMQVQPVISDVEISSAEFDRGFMEIAQTVSKRSPDWWRQIGAVAVAENGTVIAATCNIHMPNEYEAYVFGDPGINRDAGQVGKYTVLHAEEGVITHCARYGIALKDASLYVTTFPCERCGRQLADVHLKKLFFRDGFSSLNAQDVLRSRGVKIIRVVSVPEAA